MYSSSFPISRFQILLTVKSQNPYLSPFSNFGDKVARGFYKVWVFFTFIVCFSLYIQKLAWVANVNINPQVSTLYTHLRRLPISTDIPTTFMDNISYCKPLYNHEFTLSQWDAWLAVLILGYTFCGLFREAITTGTQNKLPGSSAYINV